MSAFRPCALCGADDASPCVPSCACDLCQMKAIARLAPEILPDSPTGSLELANRSVLADQPELASLHMARLRHMLEPWP